MQESAGITSREIDAEVEDLSTIEHLLPSGPFLRQALVQQVAKKLAILRPTGLPRLKSIHCEHDRVMADFEIAAVVGYGRIDGCFN